MTRVVLIVVGALCGVSGGEPSFAAEAPGAEALPDSWRAAWQAPPPADRPLQIVHGIEPRGPSGIQQILPPGGDAAPAVQPAIDYYKDLGLGGIVCNVSFKDYLRSEEKWRLLEAGVEACRKLGLVVWIYDEEGYPSGAAGGLVLAGNRELEALELAYDSSRGDPFVLRPSYEHTHACNNFYAARRYINLLDARASASFVAKTHEEYWKRLKPCFGGTIQAMFTDEPSLLAVNLGQLGEQVRKSVRVVDPPDLSLQPLPRVPWSQDLAAEYEKRYGEDLLPRRRSLFGGDTVEDKEVRRRFWALVADLVAERYYGAIGSWCAARGVASSGHKLWEEELIHHVPLDGNGLKVLTKMQIPGLDMLSSDPEAVIHTGWLGAAMPASAAILNGGRRVMTEVSDFVQTMGGGEPSGLPEMQATAAWQAAWGVTEFTLYYSPRRRPPETYRAYCEYVGRLNAILKPARPDPKVLLYYPIHDLWAEYVPVAPPLSLASQSPRARRIVESAMRAGQRLQRLQIPFCLIDHEHLAAARVKGSALALADREFTALIVPAGSELPEAAARISEGFRQAGGTVLVEDPGSDWIAKARPVFKIEPPSEAVCLGSFTRDGRSILLAVNVGKQAYDGRISVPAGRPHWLVLDPAAGTVAPAAAAAPTPDRESAVRLSLGPRAALLLVESPGDGES